MAFRLKKGLGQHFLVDQAVLRDLIAYINPQIPAHYLEIGPGSGALTQKLLAALPGPQTLEVIELDESVLPVLRQNCQPHTHRLQIHTQDVLTFDWRQAGIKRRIVGNLPYYLASTLAVDLLEVLECVQDCTFMVQQEVAHRWAAQPGQPSIGRLSILLQSFFNVSCLFDVAPEAFDPPPSVLSTVVHLQPKPVLPSVLLADLKYWTAIGFAQPRKTLLNNLKKHTSFDDFEALDIQALARPGEISLAQWLALVEALTLDSRKNHIQHGN